MLLGKRGLQGAFTMLVAWTKAKELGETVDATGQDVDAILRNLSLKISWEELPHKMTEPCTGVDFTTNDNRQEHWLSMGQDPEAFLRSTCRSIGYSIFSDQCQDLRERVLQQAMIPRLAHAEAVDYWAWRFSILSMLHLLHPEYTRYLEIGCDQRLLFNLTEQLFPTRVCVDPYSGGTAVMTSDEFFEQNTNEWDVILVDGLHHDDQVLRDVHNSLRWLSPGGTIVLHDCLPRTAQMGIKERVESPYSWTGDVWRAVLRLRGMLGVDVIVVDVDEGCGLLRKARNPRPAPRLLDGTFDYHIDFQGREVDLLQLRTMRDAAVWVKESAGRADRRLAGAKLEIEPSFTRDPVVEAINGTRVTVASMLRGLTAEDEVHLGAYSQQCFAIAGQPLGCQGFDSGVKSPEGGVIGRPFDFSIPEHASRPRLILSSWLWDEAGNMTSCPAAVNLAAQKQISSFA